MKLGGRNEDEDVVVLPHFPNTILRPTEVVVHVDKNDDGFKFAGSTKIDRGLVKDRNQSFSHKEFLSTCPYNTKLGRSQPIEKSLSEAFVSGGLGDTLGGLDRWQLSFVDTPNIPSVLVPCK